MSDVTVNYNDGRPQESLTYGERAVGISFNPDGNTDVAIIKRRFAKAIDALAELRDATTEGEVKRMLSIAITDAQSAQMWAVKAATWGL